MSIPKTLGTYITYIATLKPVHQVFIADLVKHDRRTNTTEVLKWKFFTLTDNTVTEDPDHYYFNFRSQQITVNKTTPVKFNFL